jgi:hypothetical protein
MELPAPVAVVALAVPFIVVWADLPVLVMDVMVSLVLASVYGVMLRDPDHPVDWAHLYVGFDAFHGHVLLRKYVCYGVLIAQVHTIRCL